MKTLRTLSTLTLASIALLARAAVLTLDDFDNATDVLGRDPTILLTPAHDGRYNYEGRDTLGGASDGFDERYTDVTVNPDPNATDADRLRVSVYAGSLKYSASPSVKGDLDFSYDIPVQRNVTAVRFVFGANDRTLPLGFDASGLDGSGFHGDLDVPAGGGSFDVPIDFDGASSTDFDGLTVFFDPAPGANFQIDSIQFVQAVPEPATMATVGLGAMVVARRRKRA